MWGWEVGNFYKLSLLQALHALKIPYRLLLLQALKNSTGVVGHDDDEAYQDLLKRHPTSPCPEQCTNNNTCCIDAKSKSNL